MDSGGARLALRAPSTMKALVIEDSERLRRSLQTGLTRSGFTVVAVADGEQGLDYARYGKFDVVLLGARGSC